jgi:hypothetical protein
MATTIRCALIAMLLLASGCSAFRADAGLGFGIGAEVKLPYVLHAGFNGGKYKYAGHDYEYGWHAGREDGYWETCVLLFIFHLEEYQDRFMTTYNDGLYQYTNYQYKGHHMCGVLLPYAFDVMRKRDTSRSTELAVRVSLLPLSFVLGFDPVRLVDWFSDTTGEPDDEGATEEVESPATG